MGPWGDWRRPGASWEGWRIFTRGYIVDDGRDPPRRPRARVATKPRGTRRDGRTLETISGRRKARISAETWTWRRMLHPFEGTKRAKAGALRRPLVAGGIGGRDGARQVQCGLVVSRLRFRSAHRRSRRPHTTAFSLSRKPAERRRLLQGPIGRGSSRRRWDHDKPGMTITGRIGIGSDHGRPCMCIRSADRARPLFFSESRNIPLAPTVEPMVDSCTNVGNPTETAGPND